VRSLLANPAETTQVLLMGDFNGSTPAAPHNGLVSDGDLSNVVKSNGDAKIDYIYVTPAAREHLTNPTSFVIRPEYYGENGMVFRGAYSDHLPVFVDYAITVTANQTPTATPQNVSTAEDTASMRASIKSAGGVIGRGGRSVRFGHF
jgi:hypothetical protein